MAKASLKSPKGVASYPHLNKADFKFDEDGVWKVDLIVDTEADATQEFIDTIKSVASEAFGKKAKEAHLPFFAHEEDDSKTVLRFSTKFEPALHDVHGKKVSRIGLPMIGSGSILKIMTAAESWEGKGTGVKLYLNAVQIISLVEFGGADFDDEGEGWEPEMASGDFDDEADDNSEYADKPRDEDAPAPKGKGKKGYGF